MIIALIIVVGIECALSFHLVGPQCQWSECIQNLTSCVMKWKFTNNQVYCWNEVTWNSWWSSPRTIFGPIGQICRPNKGIKEMLRMVLPGKNEPSNSLSESYILTLLGKKVQTFEVEVEGYLSSFKIINIFDIFILILF